MKNTAMFRLLVSTVFLASLCSLAEDTFLVTNNNTSAVHSFTNTSGTASVVDGMIVFEGELTADLSVPSAYDGNGILLASVQVLVQVKLFDELPSAEDVGTVQGAVLALNDDPDDPDSTTGTYYAWGTNGWVQLTNSVTDELYATAKNATNIITFIFNYSTDPITYQMNIGTTSASDELSQVITSTETTGSGITSISLSGSGSLDLDGVSSASGSTAPLSLGMSISVYYASNSVWATVSTVGENGNDTIEIFVKVGDAWEPVGEIIPCGEGAHVYTVELNGLVPGESYMFMIKDEEGHEFYLSDPLQVKVIMVGEMVMVTEMEMKKLAVTFNTEVGRRYRVKVSDSLTSGEWTVEEVYIDGAFTNVFMASENQTQIRIPINKNKAFFRIFMLED